LDHNKLIREQLLHIVFGSLIFVAIAIAAVALDLLAGYVPSLGVSPFTTHALEFTAHAILVLDLVLFFIYLAVTSVELIKGMKS
jgi:hypothetical protein